MKGKGISILSEYFLLSRTNGIDRIVNLNPFFLKGSKAVGLPTKQFFVWCFWKCKIIEKEKY